MSTGAQWFGNQAGAEIIGAPVAEVLQMLFASVGSRVSRQSGKADGPLTACPILDGSCGHARGEAVAVAGDNEMDLLARHVIREGNTATRPAAGAEDAA